MLLRHLFDFLLSIFPAQPLTQSPPINFQFIPNYDFSTLCTYNISVPDDYFSPNLLQSPRGTVQVHHCTEYVFDLLQLNVNPGGPSSFGISSYEEDGAANDTSGAVTKGGSGVVGGNVGNDSYAKEYIRKNPTPMWLKLFVCPTLSVTDIYWFLAAVVAVSLLRNVFCGIPSQYKPGKRRALFMYVFAKIGIAKPKKLYKLSENVWFLCWHTFSFSTGVYIYWQQMGTVEEPGWARLHLTEPTGQWYWLATNAEYARGSYGWPFIPPPESVSMFMILNAGFWVSCIPYLLFEKRKSDFSVMTIHHFGTVMLITLSYVSSHFRVAEVVLLLHDIVDIFLYLAKSFNCTRIPVITEIMLVLLMVVFFIFRLVLYPYYCIRPAFNGHVYLYTNFRLSSLNELPGITIFIFFLFILLILHIYWFSLLITMSYRMLTQSISGVRKDVKDIRSDSETETEVVGDKKNS